MTSSAPPTFRLPDHAGFLQNLARFAGERILAHRQAATENTHHKADGSPVTAADHEAQSIILAGLAELSPEIPVIAEEKPNPKSLTTGGTYWLVDPLDGTLDFVNGGNEFSVNIGLVVGNIPVLGVIYAPAADDFFYGEPGNIFRVRARTKTLLRAHRAVDPPPAANLITSRREARHLPIADWQRRGYVGNWRICSSAYKFGLVAAGEYDLFIRTGTTYEWDTAAGHAILRAVNGDVVTAPTEMLTYAKPDFRNGTFVAYAASYATHQLPEIFARLKSQS